MRNRILFLFIFISMVFLWASFGYSLQEETHKAINEYIADNSVNEFSLNNYLLNSLGFKTGQKEKIIGRNAEGTDVELSVFEWLGYGGVQEDRPGEWYDYLPVFGKPTRSVNHFHNPLKEWKDAGLNDIFTGQSQVRWAQNPNQDVGGKWSWLDAREYFYIALTGVDFSGNTQALEQSEKEEYFTKTFRAVGQLMHLVEDASVPEHTRNDAHVMPAYEAYVEKMRKKDLGLWESWIGEPITFDKAILDKPINDSAASVPIARIVDYDKYDGTNPSMTATLRDENTENKKPLAQLIGMSEFTNANFLSGDTMFTDYLDSTHAHYAPYPKGSNAILWIDDTNNRRYLKKTGDGETIKHLANTSMLWRGQALQCCILDS